MQKRSAPNLPNQTQDTHGREKRKHLVDVPEQQRHPTFTLTAVRSAVLADQLGCDAVAALNTLLGIPGNEATQLYGEQILGLTARLQGDNNTDISWMHSPVPVNSPTSSRKP